ncbi:hypothetical protein Tco_1015638 [Tanacetum coccineum]|uniref:Uncharacterized protein n=1 Tax=Tanacetum coccineum TaxID=301880 RepID=A0ABQ5FMP6_9ASTR
MEDDKETDEHEEVEVDDEAELKKHLVIVKDDEIAIYAIPLATKPPVIVEYKLLKEGIMTLWKLVKTKHGDIRPEDEHERVLWGDLKVMFEPDIRSEVWRILQGYTMTVWKLYDSCGVHFVRVWKSVRYGVSKELDTVYWGFFGVGTTFDIFQNIMLIPYLEYGVLSPLDTAY